jgi:hypothetical protein
MDQATPTIMLIDWKPMGTRPVGRPRQRWQEVVMEDLKKLKVKNWNKTVKDRRTWRDLTEKAKTHKVLYFQMMMMMMMMMMMIFLERCATVFQAEKYVILVCTYKIRMEIML